VSLRDRLHDDMIAAMRSGEVLRRDTLRMALSNVYALEKRDHAQRSDDATLAVLTREVKTRRESVEAFRKGSREDLAAKEEAEIGILAAYLPQPLTEDELHALISDATAATGATSARDLGRVMGRLAGPTRVRADGKHVSELVAQALATTQLLAAAPHDAAPHGGGGAGSAGGPPAG
jgi:uncharacterized protein YqeY